MLVRRDLQEQTPPAGRPGRRSRRLGWTAFLALAAVLATTIAGALHPSDASAFTWSGHGSYGPVGVPVAQVGWATVGGGFEQLQAPQRVIKESPAYAKQDQYVCITHYTWEWDGGFDYENAALPGYWILSDATKNCGWIYASQTYIYDAGYRSAYNPIWGTDLHYNVKVTWQLRSGVTVGDITINYQVGNGWDNDLRCVAGVSCFADPVVNTVAIMNDGNPIFPNAS
jgi:hypothetical protein